MKIILLIALSFLISNQSVSQSIEEDLIKNIWGEVNQHTPTHRGKAGLILVNFKSDYTFESYETTCTGDNVLQKRKLEN